MPIDSIRATRLEQVYKFLIGLRDKNFDGASLFLDGTNGTIELIRAKPQAQTEAQPIDMDTPSSSHMGQGRTKRRQSSVQTKTRKNKNKK
jgi:hypothetical protein